MGNRSSRQQVQQSQQSRQSQRSQSIDVIDKINARLIKLEQHDADQTQLITDKDHKIQRLIEELDALKNHLLSKQIASSTSISSNLGTDETELENELKRAKELSQAHIANFVDDILKDENMNIKYLPDWVEKQLYVNIFTLLISLLQKVLLTSNLKVIGHEMTFDLIAK
jgi:primase-polymerase (primpol)-like protein